MAIEYRQAPEKFHFRTPEEYLTLFTEILRRLRPDIVIERFAGEAPPRYHEAGGWGLLRNEQLSAMLEKHLKSLNAYQGELYLKKTY